MSDTVSKEDLNVALREQTDEVVSLIQSFMKQVDERFDGVEKKYDHLISTIDSFIARIDTYEKELAARDSQFEKLLVWARKVSDKTGIPLENL